jgi:hypothetical protein
MSEFPLLTGSCCKKPAIHTMDYKAFANAEGHLFFWDVQDFTRPVQITSRTCTHCGAHWYGWDGEVKQYTAKEWQERINAC